jgi:hypothetical protein
MRATIVPALGGRIIEYCSTEDGHELLGQGSPNTFGYPCSGGYEEYSLRPHQSPGFSEVFVVKHQAANEILLSTVLETGIELERLIQLNERTGDITIKTQLRNPFESALPGCLRPHLEIDLHTPSQKVETWLLRDGLWSKLEGKAGGAWYGDDVPDGWAFWSPSRHLGVWQTWSRDEIEVAIVGTIAAEPTVVALDLLHRRENQTINPNEFQEITHRFGRLQARPTETPPKN